MTVDQWVRSLALKIAAGGSKAELAVARPTKSEWEALAEVTATAIGEAFAARWGCSTEAARKAAFSLVNEMKP